MQRVHHNVETAESYYPEVSETVRYEGRLRTIDAVREAGLETCVGGILNLGETREQRVEMAFELAAIDPTSVPINLLNPRPGTKFGDREYMDPWEAVKWIAIFRLILPDALFRLCGGRVENIGELQQLAVRAGINGVMMGNFLTTLGNTPDEDRAMFENLGLNVARQPDNGANPRPDNRSGWLDGRHAGARPADGADVAGAFAGLEVRLWDPSTQLRFARKRGPVPPRPRTRARRRRRHAGLTDMSEIAARLAELKQLGLYRRTRLVSGPQGPHVVLDGKPVLLLCSNNYLGLADHPRVQEAAADAALRWGVGAGSSRLVSGTMTIHRRLEQRLAAFKGTETALLFGSGYLANLGVVGALSRRGEVVFSDELNHASIIDGCRLSRAETFVYAPQRRRASRVGAAAGGPARVADRHRVGLLDGRRRRAAGGDRRARAPPPRRARRRRRGARDGLRRARAGAARSPRPASTARSTSSIGTLGKALGAYGAFAACDEEMAALLTNTARPLIFSTAPPPPAVAGALAALDLLEESPRARGAPARERRGAARRARPRGLRRRGLGDADHPAHRRRREHRDARLRGGARARRVRPGDPAADGARRARRGCAWR